MPVPISLRKSKRLPYDKEFPFLGESAGNKSEPPGTDSFGFWYLVIHIRSSVGGVLLSHYNFTAFKTIALLGVPKAFLTSTTLNPAFSNNLTNSFSLNK